MSSDPVKIVDINGNPLTRKASMLANGTSTPFDAASPTGQNFVDWSPFLWSVDAERNIYRDRITSRVRDLVNNDGWASGSITRTLDNVIGGSFRPVSKPNYQALAAYTGNKVFDAVWAEEFSKACDAYWTLWSADDNFYCHSQRNLNFSQMMRLAFRHKMIDGDAIAYVRWMPERVGIGRAMYATAIQIIDPDRLSNPQLRFDSNIMRGGVEIDEDDVAIAYHIRQAHQGDWFSAAKTMTWSRIQRETEWGRPVIVHDFDSDRAGQHKGGSGILTPVVNRIKMLAKYDGAALDAAIIGAMFGAFIQSPYDPQLVAEALGSAESIGDYQKAR
ncbi:MAG TPA: phage portal protein, partial [Methanosarcina sp.]|nr:phage portal protein [Methanosarcina sp.]